MPNELSHHRRRVLAAVIAIDSDYAIWNAFDNEYWPALLYFIDAKGHIRHHQFGEGEYQQSEAVIQQLLLSEAGNSGFDSKPVSVDPCGAEVPADLGSLRTSETYVGAASFNNPDHVDIVIHNYRWRLGLAGGGRKHDDLEKRLAALPAIAADDHNGRGHQRRSPPGQHGYRDKFSGKYEFRPITGGVGHNLPHEAPQAFAQAIVDGDVDKFRFVQASEVLRIIVRRTAITIKTSPSTNEEFPNRRTP
jgi:hypothetical protein